MELTSEQKATFKEQRLEEYRQKIFILQMNIVALAAIGSPTEETEQVFENIKKAYLAVEAI